MQVVAAGKAVALRPGCRSALQRLLASGVPTHLVSVNWSAAYVASALGLPLLPHPSLPTATVTAGSSDSAAAAGSRDSLIVANELEVGAGGITTGRITRAVQGARDKGAAFEALAARVGAARGTDHQQQAAASTVFIGDSTSDLAALLKVQFMCGVGGSVDAMAHRPPSSVLHACACCWLCPPSTCLCSGWA